MNRKNQTLTFLIACLLIFAFTACYDKQEITLSNSTLGKECQNHFDCGIKESCNPSNNICMIDKLAFSCESDIACSSDNYRCEKPDKSDTKGKCIPHNLSDGDEDKIDITDLDKDIKDIDKTPQRECGGSCDANVEKSFCFGEDLCWCHGGKWKLFTCSSACEYKNQKSLGCGDVASLDYPYCRCTGDAVDGDDFETPEIPSEMEIDYPETCNGLCNPSKHQSFCIDYDLCSCTNGKLQITDCGNYCAYHGKVFNGCGKVSGTTSSNCQCSEIPDGDEELNEIDHDNFENLEEEVIPVGKCEDANLLCHEADLNYLCLKLDGSMPDGMQTSTGACSTAPVCSVGDVCKNMQDGSSACVPVCTGMCKNGGFCQAVGLNYQRADYVIGLCLGPMNGETPPGTRTCQYGQNPSGCAGNTSCFQKSGTSSGECLEYCGLCPTGQTCAVVTDGGMNGCVVMQGEQMAIPYDAKACISTADCPSNHFISVFK